MYFYEVFCQEETDIIVFIFISRIASSISVRSKTIVGFLYSVIKRGKKEKTRDENELHTDHESNPK